MMQRTMSLKENGTEKFVCSQLISAYVLIEDMMRVKEFCQYIKDYGYYERLKEAEKLIFEVSDKIDSEGGLMEILEGNFDGKEEISS